MQDAFVMYVDCPGCKQDGVGTRRGGTASRRHGIADARSTDVEVDGNLVRVRCEFKVPPEYAGDESKVKWHRTGRPFGAHQRTLRFPDSCDMAKIDAKMQDGTLCVSIGKHPEAKVHRIQIGGGGALQIGEGGEQRA